MELEQGDVYVGPPTEKQIRLRSLDALLRSGVEGIVNIRAPVGIIVSSAGRHAISLSGEDYAEALTGVSRPGLDSTVDKAAPVLIAVLPPVYPEDSRDRPMDVDVPNRMLTFAPRPLSLA